MKTLACFTNGILKENAVLRLMIGLCPVLAVSSNVKDALGMAVAVLFVLVASNIVISFIRKIVPDQIRIPIFIIIISTFVTTADYLMKAYVPEIHKSLGIFVPLIVVNCIILGRAEAFACKNSVFHSLLDGLGMGLGFALILFLIASVREILGGGTFLGINILSFNFKPALIMKLAPGAFITIAFFMAILNKMEKKV
ncbi:MAG: RnfABCDGE type electron transport complex subunit E [bacterium]